MRPRPDQPSKITTIFGRKVTKYYKGKLQTVIQDLDLPNPVIRTHYAHGSLKQYVRDSLCLRNLRKLRAKDLVEKLPKSRRYRLRPQGYSICLVFLKLFERVYSPLAAGLLQPYRADSKLQHHKRTQLDRLYQKIVDDLDALLHAVGLKTAA